ncbi:isoprenylcysteine carboxylmethyltransferase family protein [Bradyrhizobium sp. AUGA SZCCT0222]|uniref:methyltransferase family protein n=1 Tax=Bradyrhizobium sp. AUGA SZCCT0222 TaxID=2807668 RepID=UPI001BABE540|nr:isoprenylcysteine carboxylmethyltransferase family protein [Bradyrhizobium sp. AUGA SZCCT0222]MBR1266156.1 isoprenylcysteine carboxylmethyltransferase family protein [Bradyrhizobium sp. AUGA SZCCT0222]
MSTVTLSKSWSYDWTMRLFGSLWFMFLALCVAIRIGTLPAEPWPSLLSSLCLGSFYLLVALLILSRSPPKAQADGLPPRIAAFVGAYLPWTIGFLGKTDQTLPNLASTACILIGMIMMLVTIRHLGRSFSIVPQAHSVVQTGPYRWVRHPLYLAEEIVILGVVLQYLSVATVIVLFLHIGVQVCRILYEEDLLRRSFPEYSSYAASRWRVIPYVW